MSVLPKILQQQRNIFSRPVWYFVSHDDFFQVHSHCMKKHIRALHVSGCSNFFWKADKPHGGEKIFSSSQPNDGTRLLDRYIFVKTLVNFYEDIADGIILDTAYADSRPNEDFNPAKPVVVGLHDTPGSHYDLLPILNVFAKLGCRAIAPTFPGHGETLGLVSGYDDVFSQTTTERAAFVQDFLEDLGIERVDLLIGVGAASYTVMRLCAGWDTSLPYKSMALISPWPLQRPRYEVNPNLTRKIQHIWDHPFLRPSVHLLLPSFQFGDAHSTRDKITAAYLLGNLDLGEAGGLALATSALNIPRIVLFGEKDPMVEKELYYKFLDSLDIPRTNVNVFQGKLDAPCMPGGLVFPDGKYNLHRSHAGIISAFLLHVVQLFHPHIHL